MARLKQHDSNNEHHIQPDTIKQLNVSEQANIGIRLTCWGLDIQTTHSPAWLCPAKDGFLTSLSPSLSHKCFAPQHVDNPDVRNKLMMENVHHHVLYHLTARPVWSWCYGRQATSKEEKQPQWWKHFFLIFLLAPRFGRNQTSVRQIDQVVCALISKIDYSNKITSKLVLNYDFDQTDVLLRKSAKHVEGVMGSK